MAVTRINNNQITDAVAGNAYVGVNAAAKLQAYSITSTKIANSLTYGSDLTISGNLTVQGNVTSLDTVNLVVEDPIILLAMNQTGAPALDIGFIGQRGTSTNIAWVWKESASQFQSVYTSTTESNTTIAVSSFADVKVGNFAAAGTSTLIGNTGLGNLSLSGNISSALNVTGNITGGNILTGGLISSSGNITGGNVLFGSGIVSGTGNVTGNIINATTVSVSGNITGGNVLFGSGIVSGTGNVSGNVGTFTTHNGTTFSASGNITGGNVLFGSGIVSGTGNITGGNVLFGSGIVSGTGNVTGNVLNATTVSASGNVTGGNILTSQITGTTVTISATGGAITLSPSGNISASSKNINNVADPVAAQDAATKAYVDSVAQGLDPKASVIYATTASIIGSGYTYNNGTSGVGATLTAAAVGNLTIDGTVVSAGQRILIKNETGAYVNTTTQSAAFNGIYTVTTAGSPSVAYVITRATDFDIGTEMSSAFTFVEAGTTNADSGWVCTTNNPITVGTTQITFTQFSGAGSYTAGTGISLTGTVINAIYDNSTIGVNGSNQLYIPANAPLVTPNIGAATGTSLSVSGTVSAASVVGGVMTGTSVSVSGNITGGNVLFGSGIVSGTGNVNGNVGTFTTHNGTTFSASGNITGGNVLFGSGIVSGTGNVSGNVGTFTTVNATTVSASGNVTGGNVLFGSGIVSGTGNISGNVVTGTTGNLGNIRISVDNITTVGSNLTFNAAAANINFRVSGTAANVLAVDAASNTVIIGSLTATAVTNAALNIATTNSMIIPVGTTLQRPGTPVTGMMRYNSTTGILEYYTSNTWTTAGTSFTVINADSFTGNGVQTVYALSTASTTAATIVAINGVVQQPTLAYAVSGSTLTFTEAPATSDIIDVRELTTTTTITGIQNVSANAIIAGSATAAQFDITGAFIPTANITYDLGSASYRWKDIYLSGSSLYLGNIIMKAATGNTVAFFQPDGTTPATIAASSVDTTQIASGTSSVAVIASGGNIRSNIAGTTVQTISAGLVNITGDLTVSGNATLSGNILGDRVINGTTSFEIQTASGNANITVGGTSNVVVFSTTGTYTSGLSSVTGNIIGGNVLAGTGIISTSGNITGGNVLFGTGIVSGTGNVNGNVITATTLNATTISASGNITGGNVLFGTGIVSGTGNVSGNVGTFTTHNGTTFSASGNITGGNVLFGSGIVSGTGNVSGNVGTFTTHNGTTFSASGNVTGGNVLFGSGIVSGTGNVNGNVITATTLNSTTVSASGNITGGNVLFGSGIVSGTGNVSGNVGTFTTLNGTTFSASGNITGGNLSVGTGTLTGGNIVNSNGNGVGNIGSASVYYNTVFAKATSAQYADLAEMYEADQPIEAGTVVAFGGNNEVTTCTVDASRRVAGVVSTNPSYLMNSGQAGEYVVPVALQGRVPVRVTGTVQKGDMMVATGDGRARAEANPAVGSVIGKSLADFDGQDGVIEVVVGRV